MKRLLCFFDGTWNRPDDAQALTNVVKLYRAVPEAARDGTRQIAHYEIGIATKENFGRLTFAAGALGVGVADRVRSGYRFLVENYEPGDEVYAFGFSRGAFQARSLAGLVTLLGVLKRDALPRLDDAWAVYQSLRAGVEEAALTEMRALAHWPARVRLVGIWDTVGNLGIPLARRSSLTRTLMLAGSELSPLVDVGLHALAIDEPRGPFSPTFWTRDRDAAVPAGQTIEQVWFPGSHADVGGGFKDCGLSDISLLWMAERASATTGLEFDMDLLRRQARPDPLATATEPTSDTIFRVSRLLPYVRLLHQDLRGVSPVRRSLLKGWRTSRLPPGKDVVNEAVHESALERFGKRVKVRCGEEVRAVVYRPRTLKAELLRRKGGAQGT